ncbi:MAG: site-specific integrase [Verrucomicrobiota bacterium]|nr:site-specific integrase [Verrucomicrobiota bacterium]
MTHAITSPTDNRASALTLSFTSHPNSSPKKDSFSIISIITGARQGEILNLEWRDIDFDNHLAYLKETKNGRPRSISLDDPIIVELKRLYELRHPLKPLVFASKTAFGRIDIKKAWQTALRTAGITNFRAHDMWHTFATFAAGQGASNLELATAMGHRTLQMLQRYTHLDVQLTKKFSKGISKKILRGETDTSSDETKEECIYEMNLEKFTNLLKWIGHSDVIRSRQIRDPKEPSGFKIKREYCFDDCIPRKGLPSKIKLTFLNEYIESCLARENPPLFTSEGNL